MKQPLSVQPCQPNLTPKKRRFGVSTLALTALVLVSTPDDLAAAVFIQAFPAIHCLNRLQIALNWLQCALQRKILSSLHRLNN
jgi:hypothetical protein